MVEPGGQADRDWPFKVGLALFFLGVALLAGLDRGTDLVVGRDGGRGVEGGWLGIFRIGASVLIDIIDILLDVLGFFRAPIVADGLFIHSNNAADRDVAVAVCR